MDEQAAGRRSARVVSARVALAGAIVVGLLSGAMVAGAGGGGPFPDVGAGHPFATEIENMSEAGITGGFPDGTFRPSSPVTRQSMAAFMGRGLGRVGYTSFGAASITEITSDGGFLSLPSVTIHPGAATSGSNGFVVVTATIELNTNTDACLCSASIFLQATKNDFANIEFVGDTRNVDLSSSENNAELTTQAVVPVTAGSTWRFRVRAANDTNGFIVGNTNTQFSGSITAVYVPYGPTGTNALFP